MNLLHQRVVNSGFFAGSPEKMLQFLKMYNKLFREREDKLNNWGLDQAAINVAYHKGLLNYLNVTYITSEQRMGNDMRGKFHYDINMKVLYMYSKKCSPVIRHKVDRDNT